MRSLVITLLLIFAMLGAIALNNVYIRKTSEFISNCINEENFEADPKGSIETLDKFWQKNHPIVGLSVGYKELDQMSDLIVELRIYHELGDKGEIRRVRALILETADEISRLERFALENLL